MHVRGLPLRAALLVHPQRQWIEMLFFPYYL